MPDWLTQVVTEQSVLSIAEMTFHLLVAFAAGWAISGIYRVVRRHLEYPVSFPATLVLLTILCAMLPMIIGQNVAWAFGLVGALSIVRFRTAIKDTKDIAFVIFAVLTGMAVGAGQLPIAGIGIVIVGSASVAMRRSVSSVKKSSRHVKLTIRVASNQSVNDIFDASLEDLIESRSFLSGRTRRQGNSIELNYRIRLKVDADPVEVLSRLYRSEGIENVEINDLGLAR